MSLLADYFSQHKYTRVTAEKEFINNAPHFYEISNYYGPKVGEVKFQNGPIGEVGVNGVMDENLLAILIDRLRHFQDSPYACRENAIALTHLQEAMLWTKARTGARELRNVEGTNSV